MFAAVQADKHRKCFEFDVKSRHFGIAKSIINLIEGKKNMVLNFIIFRMNLQTLLRQSDFLRHLEAGDDDDDKCDCLQK